MTAVEYRRGSTHPILLLSLTALLVSPQVSASPPGVTPTLDLSVMLDGGCGPSSQPSPWLWDCNFAVTVSSPSLVLFRWDLNGDGLWDTGYPSNGGWISEMVIFTSYDSDGVRRVCVQAWDGVTTRLVNGRREPVGPIACRTYAFSMDLGFWPSSWDRNSTGQVTLLLYVQHEFVFPTRRAQFALIWAPWGADDVPLKVGFTFRMPGSDPTLMYFTADRAAITAAFGPGRHEEVMWAVWGAASVEEIEAGKPIIVAVGAGAFTIL